MFPKILKVVFVIGISVVNYQIARFSQIELFKIIPSFQPIVLLSFCWILLALLLIFLSKTASVGLLLDSKQIYKNKRQIFILTSLVLIGLVLFIFSGVTKYFHSVRYPFFFFIITPIVEELIFRGWVYNQIQKIQFGSPLILSSLLFALHHLQYTNYHLGLFVFFQISYAFLLGMALGKIRQLSSTIYLGAALHIVINAISVYF